MTNQNKQHAVSGKNYINNSRGILSWLLTVDHKRIALMYLVMVLGCFFLGGVFALLLRTELIAPGPTIFKSDAATVYELEEDGSYAPLVLESTSTLPEGFVWAGDDGKLDPIDGGQDNVVLSLAENDYYKLLVGEDETETYLPLEEDIAYHIAKNGELQLMLPNARRGNRYEIAYGNEASWKFYNQSFTLHGAVMVFLVIIPLIPAIIGNFVLPLQLGAKDVAFPKLNLTSWYCYMVGFVLLAMLLVGPTLTTIIENAGWEKLAESCKAYLPQGLETGWTFYTPYSTSTAQSSSVIFATLGAFVLGFSSILTGLNFIATMHLLKPKNMGWFQMPLLLWALYATSVIQILATPVLGITLLLLIAERTLSIGVFDPALQGDPVLYQHFFWFYSHPAVYIMILPGLGVVSEMITAFTRRQIFGYRFIAYSSVAIAIFGFIVWGHHMFTSGQSRMLNMIFSLLTMSVAVPSAIKVFNWLATLYKGSIRMDTPMWYALGFIWMFTIGGLTGLHLATLSTDIHFHDTYFVVAHFHYVMVGSTLFAFIGAMYYWWPKFFGKMYNEFWSKISCLVVFIGFNVTFMAQFVAGTHGMPRRYQDYTGAFGKLALVLETGEVNYWFFHFISTIGSYVLAVGLLMILITWIASLVNGKKAAANPWGANTLEWHTASPPTHHNFEEDIDGCEPYDFHGWKYNPAIDGYEKTEDHVHNKTQA